MNGQGKHRDVIEDTLVNARFYVPLYAHNKWYRKALAETGIPHMFVLGNPIIPERSDYPYKHARGSAEYEHDIGILRALTTRYHSNMQTEYDKEQLSITSNAKRAQLSIQQAKLAAEQELAHNQRPLARHSKHSCFGRTNIPSAWMPLSPNRFTHKE